MVSNHMALGVQRVHGLTNLENTGWQKRRERNVLSHELKETLMQQRLESAWTWTKARIVVSLIVAAATMFIGFRYGGWMTGGGAEEMANKRADAAVTAALLPVCLAQSKADPNSVTKLAEFHAITSSYEQHEYLVKSGWATFPGSQAANGDVAAACASALKAT
jgi:hypothetical protein